MDGEAESLLRMWKILRADHGLEDPVPMHEHVYLGFGQHNYEPTQEQLHMRREVYQRKIVKTGEEGSLLETQVTNKKTPLNKLQRREENRHPLFGAMG